MKHPSQDVRTPDNEVVKIDVGILELVQEIWRQGIKTIACCQGDPHLYGPVIPTNEMLEDWYRPIAESDPKIMEQMCHSAYLLFPTYSEFLKFMNLVGKPEAAYQAPAFEEERDNLTDRQYGDSYSKWEYTVGLPVWDKITGFQTRIAIHFPPQDIMPILDRLKANGGS